MALSRRDLLRWIPAGAGLALGCAATGREVKAPAEYVELAANTAAGPTKPVILVAMPDTTQTREVWSTLNDELGREYQLVALRVDTGAHDQVIATGIARYKPVALVLMNNPTVSAYHAYQKQVGGNRFPPAVIVMTSFLEGHPTVVSTATGISYEVPLITVVTNLRKLVATPIERVGVILRAASHGFVERQLMLAKREQIDLVQQEISANPNPAEIKWALRKIKHRIDALWILNDDRLLSPRLIAEGWLPGLNERPYCPTIVGAGSLVSPLLSFGTFAVLPDHSALGVQTANVIFKIAEDNWVLSPDAQAELPVSTTTTIDLLQARQRFSLREDALQQVDRILQ
jgi:hypothetical protein